MSHVAVMGAGAWGTALSIVATRAGHAVVLWSRSEEIVNEVNREHTNGKYLSGCALPAKLCATSQIADALAGADIVILAAPSHATRDLVRRIMPFANPSMTFVSATKGVEIDTGQRISEVVDDVFGEGEFRPRFVCLSGPSFAQEVASEQPTAVVAASNDVADSALIQGALSNPTFRIYTNEDVIGTEIGGAVKNVMAIASGMVAGLGLGANSIAALITRGLAEMARLALAEGGRLETLTGLAGLGDLVLTCTGTLSRNRHVGYELGRGRTLEDVLSGMVDVAEGVRTTRAVKLLATRAGVEMPIANEVHAVLYEGKSTRDASVALMARPLRGETP